RCGWSGNAGSVPRRRSPPPTYVSRNPRGGCHTRWVDDRGPPTRKPWNGSGPLGQSPDEPIAAAAARPGVVARLIVWSKAKPDGVTRWAVAARERHASVEIGCRLAHRDKILLDLGLGPVMASIMSDVSQQSPHARWWLLLVGRLLVLWSGYLGAKALGLFHAPV